MCRLQPAMPSNYFPRVEGSLAYVRTGPIRTSTSGGNAPVVCEREGPLVHMSTSHSLCTGNRACHVTTISRTSLAPTVGRLGGDNYSTGECVVCFHAAWSVLFYPGIFWLPFGCVNISIESWVALYRKPKNVLLSVCFTYIQKAKLSLG